MANRLDNAVNGVASAGEVGGAFSAESQITYPAGPLEAKGTDVSPSNTHKPGNAPLADRQPVNGGTNMSRHTPDMLYSKDHV